MKINHWALCLSLTTVAFAGVAKADGAMYATADMAQASCGAEPVVFIDLDRGRYYKIGQTTKTSNGVYACERVAHAKYREGKSEPTAVATK
jgi:hypothetical protein